VNPGRKTSLLVIYAVALVVGFAPVDAGNISIDFDRNTLNKPPTGATCKGSVKVVGHPKKKVGDRCVALVWKDAKDKPVMTLKSRDHKLPLRGTLRFDLLIDKHRGYLDVRGISSRNRTMFTFKIDGAGRAWTVGLDGASNQIFCNTFPPERNEWYTICLSYDLHSRMFNAVMDSNWKSGDTPTRGLHDKERLDRIVFQGHGNGESVYYADSVYLLAAQDKKKGSDGTSLPLGTYKRKIRRDTLLLADPAPLSAIIVYPSRMKGGAALGDKVRQAVRRRSGKDILCMSDEAVIDQTTWLVREEFLGRPIIALGNATDNKVIYALATRFLTLSNRKWPGEDKFCVRSILEPFRADVNWVVVEASTLEGLGAGVNALCKRIKAAPASNLNLAYFRELGAAKGTWKETRFKKRGLDLTKSIEDIKKQIIKKNGLSARITPGSLFYYSAWSWMGGASPEAAKYAAGVLLMQMERDPYYIRVGHYNFDYAIKAWQICFTSGVVDDAMINRVEAAMARTAGNPAYLSGDWYADSIRRDGGRKMALYISRHWLATLANFLCGSDYVLSHARLNPVTRKIVEDYHQAYLTASRRFIDSYRTRGETSEGGDNNTMLVNLMALSGNMAYVRNGTLARAVEAYMARTNNLGFFVGEGAYIGSQIDSRMPGRIVMGAAAFYYDDPEFQWLWKNFKGTTWSRTTKINSVFDDERPERFPQRYIGLNVLPLDPNNYRTLTMSSELADKWHICVARPIEQPIESLYNFATFRDGFAPENAFLTMYGSQGSTVMLANTIAQYTDLGQILLFASTRLLDRWCRSSALASNGLPCQPAAACINKATISTPVVSAISSVDPYNGNTESTRTIVHRAGHYFVVFDTFKALSDDDYTFTVRWRSLYPASLEGATWTENAPQGVQFRLINAEGIQQECKREDSDGDYRPFILTQNKQARLKAGEAVSLANMFYASSDSRPDNCEVRSAGPGCVLVRGSGKNWKETALIGTGQSPSQLKQLDIKADIFYISGEDLVAANATRVKINGKSFMKGTAPANITLKVKEHNLAAALDKTFDNTRPASGRPAQDRKDYGFKKLWQFTGAKHPPVQYRAASITADRKPWSYKGVEILIDTNRKIAAKAPRNGASWKSAGGPLNLTLDLGEVKDIGSVRLFGTVATGYIRKFAWGKGDMKVAVAFSNDNFEKDIREDKKPITTYNEFSRPRVHYVWSARVPHLTIKAPSRARYVRLTLSTALEYISLQKIIVEGRKPRESLLCDLKSSDLDGDGNEEVLVKTNNREIVALASDGKKRWSKNFGGEIVTWFSQDLETDKRAEVVAFTSDDICYALNGNGSQRWLKDFYEYTKKGSKEKWQRWYCQYLFKTMTAGRPDASGRKEVIGVPKGPAVTTIKPDLSIAEYKGLGTVNTAVIATDNKVLGREVTLLAGRLLIVKDTKGRSIVNRNFKGRLGGNSDFPVFVAAAAVADRTQRGFLGINPSSIEWAPVGKNDKAGKGWGKFSEIPISAYLLKDLDGDGDSELLIGYKDGFVRAHRLSDGKILKKVCVGSPVTGITTLGSDIIIGSRDSVRRCDSSLKERGVLNIKAVSVVGVRGKKPIVCVVDENGTIHALDTSAR